MITVHHLESSRSHRVLWLLEELKLPYEVRPYKREKSMAAPPELKRVHPLGKSPVIEDDGVVVAETGAILEYIVEKAGGRLGAPAPREEALRYRYFMHYGEGSLMPPLMINVILGFIPLFGKAGQKRFRPMVAGHLDFVEAELAQRPWFAGECFTAADVMMSFPVEFTNTLVKGQPARPKTTAWREKIKARPAYQAALKAGGAYTFG